MTPYPAPGALAAYGPQRLEPLLKLPEKLIQLLKRLIQELPELIPEFALII